MLYKLGLKVTGFRLYFGCILVVCWSQDNVVTTLFGVYILRRHNVNLQRCDNQNTTLLQRCHNVILFAGDVFTYNVSD